MKTPIQHLANTVLPTDWGTFDMHAFGQEGDAMPHIVLMHPDIDVSLPVTLRIHSECLTGDLFHSLRCECGQQLDAAMQIIEDKQGILLYLRQEGRGIGIINKMKAYNLQDQGFDTLDANLQLGLEADGREYSMALTMLRYFDIKAVRLLTNNPEKVAAFEGSDITVTERLPLIIEAKPQNEGYLSTKKLKFGHLL